MENPLPKYQGNLIPTSWSRVELTPANKFALAHAALFSCPSCKGEGFLIAPDASAHPCHCTRRQLGSPSTQP